MIWYYGNIDNSDRILCTNNITSEYRIILTPDKKIRDKDLVNDEEVRYMIMFVNNIPTLESIKKHLLYLQSEYDKDFEVNGFYLNDKHMWLDKATRVGLVNSLNIQKENNITESTLWFKNKEIIINVDKALTLLNAIELYALECYNNTQKHLYEISKFETIEECLNFDITAGYPNKLNIQID